MRAPVSWLRELAPTQLSPEQLARALTMAGAEVTRLDRSDGDAVLELEITPNRADCLSMIGLAREVAAITGGKLRVPLATSNQRPTTKTHGGSRPIIRIQDRKGCSQYLGRVITGITVGPSPDWMQRRLSACGIRPINNVVDSTNYVLLEWGQPLHAFDWTTIRQGTIVVRRAHAGERLRTLDDAARTLDPSMLVIADAERAVAIAGIMGGTDTAVTPQTRAVLLESAQFDPRTIRLTARKMALHSESSYRFERGIDPAGVELASRRAAQLLAELADGTEITRVHAGSRSARARTIVVVPDLFERRLGTALPLPRTRRMLESLGCHVRTRDARWTVQVPTHRHDLSQPVDLIEEVARLVGYERVPSALPRITVNPAVPSRDGLRELREAVRQHLLACGLSEAVTWSLLPGTLLTTSGTAVSDAVRISNPLSQEQAYLRPAMWPRVAQAVATNLHRQLPGAALFEIGNVYRQAEGRLRTAPHVGLAMSGTLSRHWQADGRIEADVFVLKGVLESLARRLHLPDTRFEPTTDAHGAFDVSYSATWTSGAHELGVLGVLNADMRQSLEVDAPLVIGECDLGALHQLVPRELRYRALPRVPAVKRDLSLIVNDPHPHAALARAIREAGGAALEDVTLIDRYTQPPIPSGSVGLTYTLSFRDPARTLTDAAVDELQSRIVHALTQQFHAMLRT